MPLFPNTGPITSTRELIGMTRCCWHTASVRASIIMMLGLLLGIIPSPESLAGPFDRIAPPETGSEAGTSGVVPKQEEPGVILSNGDRISGTLLGLDEESVHLRTPYAGTLTIERESVRSFVTDQPVTVIFDNDQYITGRLEPAVGGTRVIAKRMGASQVFETTEVRSIYPGDPRRALRQKLEVKFTGHLNVGFSLRRGNTNREHYRIDGRMRARTPENRYTLEGQYTKEKSDNRLTEKNASGLIKYDHFLTEKVFLFNSASFEKDEFQDLKLRSALAIGIGYQFLETPDQFLSAEMGLVYTDENFEDAEDQTSGGIRYALDYEQALGDWGEFFHRHRVLAGPHIDFALTSETGQRFPLAENFHATLQWNFDWDNPPPPGASSSDVEYLFTLGYEF